LLDISYFISYFGPAPLNATIQQDKKIRVRSLGHLLHWSPVTMEFRKVLLCFRQTSMRTTLHVVRPKTDHLQLILNKKSVRHST